MTHRGPFQPLPFCDSVARRGGRCPIPGNAQGQVGRGSEQPDPGEDVPAYCRGLGWMSSEGPFRPKPFSYLWIMDGISCYFFPPLYQCLPLLPSCCQQAGVKAWSFAIPCYRTVHELTEQLHGSYSWHVAGNLERACWQSGHSPSPSQPRCSAAALRSRKKKKKITFYSS